MSFVHLAGLGRALSAASAALVLPSSGPAAVDHARGVALEGVYTYSLLMGASKASWSAAHSFRLEIRGCEWTIEHRDLSSATNKGLASVRGIAACDGANVYTVDYQSGAAARIAWGRDYDSVKDKLPEGLISILPGLYPPPDGPVVQHIWLALASGCALPGARGTTKPLAPVDLALFSDRRFSCGYEWFTNAGGSGLPSLALISDGYTLARSSKGSIVRVPFASRLSAGFTNTLVNWRQAASINGVLLPMDVELYELRARRHRPVRLFQVSLPSHKRERVQHGKHTSAAKRGCLCRHGQAVHGPGLRFVPVRRHESLAAYGRRQHCQADGAFTQGNT